MSNKKVWFITGASQGFGLILAKKLLEKGDFVAATSRRKSDLEREISPKSNQFLPLEMNLTDENDVKKAIDETIAAFGKIDNIINNAGYGLLGAVEELSDAEARQNFDVNVFGSLNVIRQALPHMRRQQSGHIFNIASIGGYLGDFPGFGIYCATKFAVVGFSEAMAIELKDFGINVTAVLPGYFRTNFLTSGSLSTPQNPLDDYKSTRESQELHQQQINNNQPGDPEKGAAAIIQIAGEKNPPVHLFLGSDAYGLAKTKAENVMNELEVWKSVTVNTDF
ncbi:short-chain dehydrogenase/reductase [Flavobacterium noncentrifugens]|uniref:Short-chain dehydrogenase n=1 Tax=Flavobacterium noncentrifugens TaxID=1128970 RepID=A0A1G9CCQ7_9FLAO|nr:oxidoreductase [Flavobacterium noncentrifugens]GEP51984.1 short-chain dehydrogenase/reductase [Flavobacterium noncentrifugens]SDK49215.1 Short-chain dehydrogenase [Flavobacterium noncentrifugens]